MDIISNRLEDIMDKKFKIPRKNITKFQNKNLIAKPN